MSEPSPQARVAVQSGEAIFVFGGSGLVGAHVLAQASSRGLDVDAVTRSTSPPFALERVRWQCGPHAGLSGEGPWPLARTILSLGPLVDFAAWLERTRPAQARRVVALSSTSAVTKQASPDPRERALASRLIAAEATLIAACERAGIAWTILRPTLIWGDGRDRNLSRLAAFARRWRVLPLPAFATGLRQPIHARDVAAAVLAALDRPDSAGCVLDLPGGETLPYIEMARRVAAAVAPPGRIVRVPAVVARIATAVSPARTAAIARMADDLVFDGTPARQRLDIALTPFGPREDDFPAP